MVLNGTIGARLHVPFPVLNRSSFGFWFSYFSVVSRVVLSMFWFGIQTFTGSECVYQVRAGIEDSMDADFGYVDAQSDMAVPREDAQPFICRCQHHKLG